MNKSRDVSRGASRFSRRIKQSGQKLLTGLHGVGEEFVSMEKPKKEKLNKKLNVVNKASSSYDACEMGYNPNMSDGENEFPAQSQCLMSNASPRRFKLPKKFFDDCNGVDHSSVPRKLRSAMKKRNRESVSPTSPDSKKQNHTIGGVESLKKDGLKKSKLNMKQGSSDWSPNQSVGPITKDEEEVVETLYALAGMFPDNDTADKTELVSAASEANPPALLEQRERPTPAIKDSAVTKENLTTTCPLRNSEAAPSWNVEILQKETAKVNLMEPMVKEEPGLRNSKNFHMKTDCCVPPINMHSITPSLSTRELNDDKPSCNPVNLHVLPGLCLDSGLEQSTQKEIFSLHRKTELPSVAANFGSQLVQQDMVMESRKNGPALWPRLSPTVLHGGGSPVPSSQSSAAKIPAWLDAAMGTSRPCSSENGPSTGKVYKGATARRYLKRCAAHVYVSHLIHNLQIQDDKQKLPLQCNQLKPPLEGQKQGILVAINDFDRENKGLNGAMLGNISGTTIDERNSGEARSTILQLKRLHQDQQQTATSSGLQKQSLNFLSLSAGWGGAEATKNFHRTRNNATEPSSDFQISYLQSVPRHQKFVSLAMPRTHYAFPAYPDKPSTAATAPAPAQQVQLQLPRYRSSPFLGHTHPNSPALTKQQQQQQLWAAQVAAHCRPAGNSTSTSQLANWPNGTQDPALIPCPQSSISYSSSALEVLGPKYSQISQQQQLQQQHLMAITSSLPSARLKRQDHHFPLVYAEIEGGSLPLQLLCSERL